MIDIPTALSAVDVKCFRDIYDSAVVYKDERGRKIDIKDWVVYTLVQEASAQFADDEDVAIRVDWYVNYYCSEISKAEQMKLKIRDALRSAGFTINNTTLSYENETRLYHLMIYVTELCGMEYSEIENV